MVKLLAVLCTFAAPYVCHDETVRAGTSLSMCQIAIRDLPDWMNDHPQYWLKGWKCQMGSKASERSA